MIALQEIYKTLAKYTEPISQDDRDNLFILSFEAIEVALINSVPGYTYLRSELVSKKEGLKITPRANQMTCPMMMKLSFITLDWLEQSNQTEAASVLQSQVTDFETESFILIRIESNSEVNQLYKIFDRQILKTSLFHNQIRYHDLKAAGGYK